MQATKEEIVTVNLSMSKEEARTLYVIVMLTAGSGAYRRTVNDFCSSLSSMVGGVISEEEKALASLIRIEV